jgi:hypothetical protein
MGAALAALALGSCDYVEVEREIGYKGKARVNPWLAAERYSQREGHEVKSVISWTAPEWDDATWLMPAAVLSNESFVRRVAEWVRGGGHLILVVEHATSDRNDWSTYPGETIVEPPLLRMLEGEGITLEMKPSGNRVSADKIRFDGVTYKVDAASDCSVKAGKRKPGIFASRASGDGRITVVTDGRIFRNRWIGEHEHAALFDALVSATGYEGSIGFMRGTGMSFFAMLGQYLWPVLIGLGVWVVFWLWRNFRRFGPVETDATPQVLRGYEHHLEALGDFQWRRDRAVSLLSPLREQVVELGQRASHRAGRRDADFFQYLADLAGIPREHVFRALAEPAPSDAVILTRTTADLQLLLQLLQSSQRS